MTALVSRRSPRGAAASRGGPGQPEQRRIRRLVSLLLMWFDRNARELPWRNTLDPYAVWVSEIMLQQTQVKTVIPYWERWMRELPTVTALAGASPDKVLKLWEGLGYYTRARNLQQAARRIVEERGGKFPVEFEQILALPGVGRYTAGAIASIAFNQPRPILDGNVIRVLTRLFGIAEDPKGRQANARLWELAAALVSAAARLKPGSSAGRSRICTAGPCSTLNQSLMELGALVCTPKQPRCGSCPWRRQCEALRSGRVNVLPRLGARAAPTARRFVSFVARREERWLVSQRPHGVVNASLWEFPNVEVDAGGQAAEAGDLPRLAARILGVRPATLMPLATVKHSITRYRISLEAFQATVRDAGPATGNARWLTLAEMERLAFTSAHRKVLRALLSAEKAVR